MVTPQCLETSPSFSVDETGMFGMFHSPGHGTSTDFPFDRDKLQAAEEKQEKLRQTVKKTRKFTQTEQNALNIDSIEAFQHFWQGALDAKPKFDKRHEQGVGKVTKDATDFGSRAYDVLTTLNPMLDIIKDFGHPFGGMAVGTICFFLTVRTV